MLSLSLAFRQQGRCIQAAVARGAFIQPTTPANCRLNTWTLAPVSNNVNDLKAHTSTIVPARHFSVTHAKRSSGDHVKLWTAERLVSAAMIPGFIMPFVFTNPMTDAIFSILLVLHSHWGIEAIVVDYIRPSLFGGSTTIPNIAQAGVWFLSAVTLGGLFYFNYTDVGIVNAIKMLWKV